MKHLAACVFLLMYYGPVCACTLTFPPNFHTLSGRVASIELVIKHGAVADIRNIAPGWRYSIDNDASWNTRVSGHALVGAAFMQMIDLKNLIRIRAEPHHNCKKLGKPGMLHIIIQLYRNDYLETLVVNHLTATD